MTEKLKVHAKAAVNSESLKILAVKSHLKEKPTRKLMTKPEAKETSVIEVSEKSVIKPSNAPKSSATVIKRVIPLLPRRPIKRSKRSNQFAYMKAPGFEYAFEVGDTVEVFCDHEKSRERIRGWVKGIVVQVDQKMVAVQFRSNVYLTDGWMVPDRILWYPVNSEHIRPVSGKKVVKDKKDFIPDY
jgi:hypothetical protein